MGWLRCSRHRRRAVRVAGRNTRVRCHRHSPRQVTLTPAIGTAGDADLFVGDAWIPVPGIPAYNRSSATNQVEIVHVPASWCTAPSCWFYISALAYAPVNQSYILLASTGRTPVPLNDGVPVGGTVSANDADFYSAAFTPAFLGDSYAVSLTTIAGDPDVYVLINPDQGECGGHSAGRAGRG